MNYDGPAIADALARARHRMKRDEALLRQALEALETPIHEQPLGMRQGVITALRERLGNQPPADVEDRLARHGIPMLEDENPSFG